MASAGIKHISCDSFANESEETATEHILNKLKNHKHAGTWYVFTNYSVFSDISYHIPLEIDMLFIGTKGLQVIEIKHWNGVYINNRDNLEIINREAVKLNNKVKKIAGKIRQTRCGKTLGHIDGKFLLTGNKKEIFKGPSGRKTTGGIEFFGLEEWEEMLELNNAINLGTDDIEMLCSILEPQSKPLVTSKIRNFQNFINLELLSPEKELFCRIYRCLRKPGREKVILNLYDLSANTEANALNAAQREFKVIQKLQKSEFIPRIMDSFQEAHNYPGELYFFSYIEPEAPSLMSRNKDKNWHREDKIYTAKTCFDALSEFHDGSVNILHRNITPDTIKIRSNNKPVFTQLQFSRITGATTIAGLIAPEFKGIEQFVAPEVKPAGIAGCTKQSDIYSLCASLSIIFKDDSDGKSALNILSEGLNIDPLKRPDLNELRKKFENLYKKPDHDEEDIDVKYWDEDTVKELNGRYYRIITRLGSGNVGSTFKVMEVYPQDLKKYKSGPYVAKVITNETIAEQSMEAYSRVRGQSGGNHLAGVLEGRTEWKRNEITSLLKWIEGEPLSEVSDRLHLYLDTLGDKDREVFILTWVKNLCEGLTQMHKENLVHGDVSPKNIIVHGEKITLTDFDLSVESGTEAIGGTTYYCPSNVTQRAPTTPSDDIFSLAASIFHILFNRLPFEFDTITDKSRGMNWDGLDQSCYRNLAEFLKKATHRDLSRRYTSSVDALAEVSQLIKKISEPSLPPGSGIPPDNNNNDTLAHIMSESINHLGKDIMPEQLYNILKKNNIKTIGQVMELNDDDFSKFSGAGKKKLNLFGKLKEALLRNPEIVNKIYQDITEEKKTDSISINPSQRHTEQNEKQSIEHIEIDYLKSLIPQKLYNVFEENDIKNIGQIMKLDEEDFERLKNVGMKKVVLFRLFSEEVLSNPELIHNTYLRNKEVELPLIDNDEYLTLNFMEKFKKIIDDFYENIGEEKAKLMIYKRWGIKETRTYTLEEIGIFLGLTRERIRQIIEKNIQLLSNFISGKHMKNFKCKSDFSLEMERLKKFLQKKNIITREDLYKELAEEFNSNLPESDDNYLDLLCNILEMNYKEVNYMENSFIIIDKNIDRNFCEKIFKNVYSVLLEAVIPVSKFDITIKVKKRLKDNKISNNYIDIALKTNQIEEIQPGYYQLKFEYLNTLADCAYRILYEKKEPLHYTDIFTEANHRLAGTSRGLIKDERSIANQTSSDIRFVAIGKSGIWALKEWNVNTNAIIDLIREAFHYYNKALTYNEVLSYIQSKRKDASPNSISIYLCGEQFSKINNQYILREWQNKKRSGEQVPKTEKFLISETNTEEGEVNKEGETKEPDNLNEVNTAEEQKQAEPLEDKGKEIILPEHQETKTDDITDDNSLYLQFWKTLLKEMNKKSHICHNIIPGNDNWISIASGISGVTFDFVLSRDCGIGLYIGRTSVQENKSIFDELKRQIDEIERDFEGQLIWERLDNKKSSRIRAELKDVNIQNKEDWKKMIDFMTDGMINLKKSFKKHIINIKSRLKS